MYPNTAPRYTAIDAIGPAIARTREFLFTPFRWGRLLKLTVVAALTEASFAGFNLPGRFAGTDQPPTLPPTIPPMHWPALPIGLGILLVVGLLAIPIWLVVTYLINRLRFSFFECVLLEQDEIAPAWSRYHQQALRMLLLQILLTIISMATLVLLLWKIVSVLKPLFQSGAPLNPLAIFGAVLPYQLWILLWALIMLSLLTLLNEFVLPHMAIEDASIASSTGAVWEAILREPGQFAMFLLMRFLLPFLAGIAGTIALIIPFVLAVVGLVLCGAALRGVLPGPGFAMVLLLLGISLGIFLGVLLILAGFILHGLLGTWLRNYSLLFYGSRYPALGEVLWLAPPALAPAQPPAPFDPS